MKVEEEQSQSKSQIISETNKKINKQIEKRKSPSPKTVPNEDEKITDANSNQEKQLKHCNLPGCENIVISNRFGHYCSDECNVQFVSQCFRAFINHRPTSAK